jgi:glycine cleavage system H protein
LNTPENLKYTAEHEWVRSEPDGTVTIGITDHAQAALGDLVFIEVPEAGRRLAQGEACCVVESVKAASDVYAPIAGDVIAGNQALADAPEKVNQDPYGAWLFKVKPANAADLAKLLDVAAYRKGLEEAGEG